MPGIFDTLTKGLNPVGVGLNILGAGGSIIGAIGQKNAIRDRINEQKQFAAKQQDLFKSGSADLMAKAKAASTYQGDLQRYTKAELAADMAARMASGRSRGAGEQIARDQASLTSANALAAATRGAGSGSDLMTAALAVQQGENQAQNAISQRSAQEQIAEKNLAQQQQFNALGQTAAASARERGLEFSSIANKEANIMGLSQNQLEGQMNLNQQQFGAEQELAMQLATAQNAIWSGIGGVASNLGTSLLGMQANADSMSNLQKLYGGNLGSALKTWGGGGASPTQLRGFSNFLAGEGRQIAPGVIPGLPSNVSPYSAPAPLMPTQPSFNLFGNLPQPR